ncbi:anti-sigma factor family protein [candidate division KSB1 bacterium]
MSKQDNTCDVSTYKVLDFLFKELSLDETAALDGHIRSCDQCREKLDSFSNLFSVLRTEHAEDVQVDTYFKLKSAVMRRETAQQDTVRGSILHILQKASLIASASSVILLTLLFSGGFHIDEPSGTHSAFYESWYIDTSMVYSDVARIYVFDSLLNLMHDATAAKMLLSPNIKMKENASTIVTDQLTDHPQNSGLPILEPEILPGLPRKSKIISNNVDVMKENRQIPLAGNLRTA